MRARLALAALLVAAGAGWAFLRPGDQALSFVLGAQGAPGSVGASITAPAAATLPLRFADGSEVRLMPGSAARVVHTDARGADLVVERGRAQVAIVAAARARWRVSAGNRTFETAGARFELSWDPDSERLALDVAEGEVQAKTPARTLGAGAALRLGPSRVSVP